MSVNVQANELETCTVITMSLHGAFTLEEWFTGLETLLETSREARAEGRALGIILDYTDVTRLPSGTLANYPRTAAMLQEYGEDDSVPSFVTGISRPMQRILEIYRRVFGGGFAYADTPQEATRLIVAQLEAQHTD